MENNKILTLTERSELYVNDVQQVKCFDEDGAVLATRRGLLKVEGSDIHIANLDVAGGVAQITGKIDAIVYEDESDDRKKGLRAKLFG